MHTIINILEVVVGIHSIITLLSIIIIDYKEKISRDLVGTVKKETHIDMLPPRIAAFTLAIAFMIAYIFSFFESFIKFNGEIYIYNEIKEWYWTRKSKRLFNKIKKKHGLNDTPKDGDSDKLT
jgi:hypothetical protein